MCTDIKIFNPWGVRAVPLKPVGSYFTEMKEIRLGNSGKVALVDDEDYDKVKGWAWCIRHNHGNDYAYAKTKGTYNRKCIVMHRLIMNAPKGTILDHIDHDGLNNQKSNLRFCTNSQNCMNRKAIGRSKYLGVSWTTLERKWKAHVKVNKKAIHLGTFADEEMAARAYDEAAKVYYGDFANLNFKT